MIPKAKPTNKALSLGPLKRGPHNGMTRPLLTAIAIIAFAIVGCTGLTTTNDRFENAQSLPDSLSDSDGIGQNQRAGLNPQQDHADGVPSDEREPDMDRVFEDEPGFSEEGFDQTDGDEDERHEAEGDAAL